MTVPEINLLLTFPPTEVPTGNSPSTLELETTLRLIGQLQESAPVSLSFQDQMVTAEVPAYNSSLEIFRSEYPDIKVGLWTDLTLLPETPHPSEFENLLYRFQRLENRSSLLLCTGRPEHARNLYTSLVMIKTLCQDPLYLLSSHRTSRFLGSTLGFQTVEFLSGLTEGTQALFLDRDQMVNHEDYFSSDLETLFLAPSLL